MSVVTAAVPPIVASNLAFFTESGIWHLASQNPPALSCADAAHKRRRLGHIGIPLSDELKSAAGVVVDSRGSRRYVVIHCRGHQFLDDSKVAAACGGPVHRLGADELAAQFGLAYGVVTPFSFRDRDDVRQIFDSTVLAPYFPPHTMMTNLGHREHAVEFHALAVIEGLPGALVADVVDSRSARIPVEHTLGILTGNSPESGMRLWEEINEAIRTHPTVEFRGDIGFPRVIVESVPGMGLSMELAEREADVRPVVLEGTRRLCAQGATVVGIACNTTQHFAPEIAQVCETHGAQFVSMADETAAFLIAEGIARFDFLGIGSVAEFDEWSGFGRIAREFDLVRPDERDIAAVTEFAFKVKREGVSGATVNKLRDLVNRATETDTVLVALTELSIVLASQKRRQKSGKRFVDTLEILGRRMADIYMRERMAVESQTPGGPGSGSTSAPAPVARA